MAKKLKLNVAIICYIGVFNFSLVFGFPISLPGFAYTPGVSGQIVDKNGKPLPGAYILYDYHGYTPGTLGGSSPDYVKNPTITVTDTNGQFAIPALSFKKPLGYGRPKFAILEGYSPITHSAFKVSPSGNHQKIILQDNSNDPQTWKKDLDTIEDSYHQLVFDLDEVEWGRNFAQKNEKGFNDMLQSERDIEQELLDERTKNDSAFRKRAQEKAAKHDWDSAIAEITKAIEIRPDNDDYAYRGNWKNSKGDLDGALADFDKAIELRPEYYYAYFARGKVEDTQGNWNGALADFNKAIELNTNFFDAYISRSEVKREKGDSDALADFNNVIKLYQNRSSAEQAKGDYRWSFDLKKVRELNQRMQDLIKTNGYSMSMTNSK